MTENEEKKTDGPACSCGSGNCGGGFGKWIVAVLVLAVIGVLIAKQAGNKPGNGNTVPAGATPSTLTNTAGNAPAPEATATNAKALPRLVDLGANKCIPCKMMAPILDDLKKTYAGKLNVEFIDIWVNPDAGKEYGINLIPTQIFYDATGKELFRHEGFFSKEDILAKWKELGVELPVTQEDKPKAKE